jgi:hypothetical protein
MNALRFFIKNKHKMRYNLVEMPKIEIKIKKKRRVFLWVFVSPHGKDAKSDQYDDYHHDQGNDNQHFH